MVNPKEIVDRNMQAWRSNDVETYVQCYSDDGVIITPGGTEARGRDSIKQFMYIWVSAAPDNSIEITSEYVAGSVVVHEGIFRGTHTGDLVSANGQVIAPTGKVFELSYAEVFLVTEGLISSQRLYYDQLDILTQLGLMPEL
ncbi:ester cyclase [Saccharopolyspora sp. NPDC000995]